MKKQTHTIFCTLLTVMIMSCGGYKDVRPGLNNLHKVSVKAETKQQGAQNALKQAKRFCKKNERKGYAIVSEEQKYVGEMDESTYKAAKKVSKAAEIVGAGIFTTSDNSSGQNAGEIVGMSGIATDTILGENYQVTMEFKCQ
ncbi:MAG TPA: hypothetical protein PKC21_00585 [Oligoflexia bacterium]|mgnify:CR=1 FL=1|nr:hypothetical protein [Oligoflexia bacterium]HMR23824.1 hypothetical protein [Oligoflexia bacterium]